MTTSVPIGEFSRLTHLSVKALRHYHESGVLMPTEIDASTGYRRYDLTLLPAAMLVRRLRALSMSLSDVRAVLAAESDEARNRIVLAHLDRMEQQLAETQRAVRSLRALLSEPLLSLAISYRLAPASLSIALRGHTDRSGIDAWCAMAYPRLYDALAAAGSMPTGPGGALYPNGWFEEDEGEVVAFVPAATPPAAEGLEVLTVPASWLAVAVHAGPFAELDRTYSALGANVAQHDLGTEGPIREYYLVTPIDVTDHADLRTEVCWPITHP